MSSFIRARKSFPTEAVSRNTLKFCLSKSFCSASSIIPAQMSWNASLTSPMSFSAWSITTRNGRCASMPKNPFWCWMQREIINCIANDDLPTPDWLTSNIEPPLQSHLNLPITKFGSALRSNCSRASRDISSSPVFLVAPNDFAVPST